MKRISILLVILGLTLNGLLAQDLWTPEEIINTKYVANPSISPNGKLVVWTQRRGLKKEDKFVNDLYLARLDMKKDGKIRTFPLTTSDENDFSPIFSEDSEELYFLSSREEGKVLWRLNLLGGEPEEIQKFENGISNISWLKPGVIAYTSNEGKSLYEIENEKDNTNIVEDTAHWKARRLYSFDVKEKKIERLTSNRFQVRQYATSKNGEYLIYQLIMSPDYGVDGNPKPQYYLKNLETDNEIRILEGMQEPGKFKFTNSGVGFYFFATKSSNPEWNGAGINELYFYNLSSNDHTKVELDWENGASDYWLAGDHVVAQLANGPLKEVAFYKKSGTAWSRSSLSFGDSMENHVSLMALSDQGTKLVYNHSTASSLPEYYVADLAMGKRATTIGGSEKLTSLNDKLKKKPIAKSEIIYWTGANDDEVNGILYYPKNYEEGKQYPLILSIHGGPTGVDRDAWSERWSTYPQIYTDKGAFVLKPNYHGSSSHGLEFIESIKGGNYYHLEEIDIYNGIQHLKSKGMIDMDKLGTMGWSNGAILTTWMTLKYPDMFKVAAPGAGDINWTSDYGTCQFGVTFDQSYFGGAPWDDMNGKHYNEWYINNSPIFEIEKIKTPTIIFHGSEDRAVPRDQGWEYYRGLQQVGVAPVKFLWFPGQPHGLQKITHQMRKMKEEIKWIDKYLFQKEDERNEALKEGSPLATQILLSNSRSEGYYGVQANGSLVPDMVELGEDTIAVGRFEVTMAQYNAYKSGEFDASEANRPVLGLSKADIDGYLLWLSQKTSATYRLPNKEEAEKLHELGRKEAKSQNNLNYWAGYELTATDVEALQSEFSKVDGSLIRTVGSFPAVKVKDKTMLFDLGGNAAEYYLENGQIKAYDYSAYDFVDLYDRSSSAASKNTGFRVVREK